MKSKMLSQCSFGMGKGCKGPAGLEIDDLLRRQSAQEGMYPSSKSLRIPGQKYDC